MANESEAIVRRKCQQCGTRNWTEAASVNARLRCANCGALLYPEENPRYVPPHAMSVAPSGSAVDGFARLCGTLLTLAVLAGGVWLAAKFFEAQKRPGAELRINL